MVDIAVLPCFFWKWRVVRELCNGKHIAGKLSGTPHLALRKENSTIPQVEACKNLLFACTLTGMVFA